MAEKDHLDGENSKKAQELQELHLKLAGNMGHQNQKQKIKYLVSQSHWDSLTDELYNHELVQAKVKQENQDLREKVSVTEGLLKKAKRQNEALVDDINALKGIKRFDPRKAFSNVNN